MKKLYPKLAIVVGAFLLIAIILIAVFKTNDQNLVNNPEIQSANSTSYDFIKKGENKKWLYFEENRVTPNELCTKYKGCFGLSKDDSLSITEIKKSDSVEVRYTIQQLRGGIKVESATAFFHTKNGFVYRVKQNFFENVKITNDCIINKEKLADILSAIMSIDSTIAIDFASKSELVLLKIGGVSGSQNDLKFCWKANIKLKDYTKSRVIYIDAESGEIRKSVSLIRSCSSGTGTTAFNGEQTIHTQYINAILGYKLYDDCGHQFYTASIHTIEDKPNPEYYDADNKWTNSSDMPGVQTHWAAHQVLDYFGSYWGRNSYDNKGSKLVCYNQSNLQFQFDNANWYQDTIRLGTGSAFSNYDNYNTLDIIGHEFTHGITEYDAPLNYEKESGALNESFSDIFGTAVQRWVTGKDNWEMGEERGTPLRSLSNPKLYGQPTTRFYKPWYSFDDGCIAAKENDNCGVHTNSGVQNYWFYLLVNGGSETNDIGNKFNIAGIGFADAIKITYRNLTNELSGDDNYDDAREGSINAAIYHFGANSKQVCSVKQAWYAVGVGANCDNTSGTNFTITTSSNPTNGGSTSGGGAFQNGQTCTVKATANSGYAFKNWTLNGNEVSTNTSYQFTVSANKTLIANFIQNATTNNDEPCDAEPLNVQSSCNYETKTIIGATKSTQVSDASCDQPSNVDVWFKFIIPNSKFGIHTNSVSISSNDCGLAIYTGSCSSLTERYCTKGGNPSQSYMPWDDNIDLSSYAGQTGYIRIWEYGTVSQTGDFQICITGASSNNNNDCTITFISENTITKNATSFTSTPGSDDIYFNAQANCSFVVTNDCPWLTINPMSGNTNSNKQGFLDYSILENNSTSDRQYTFYINDSPVTILQRGIEQEDCTSPTVNVDDKSGSSSVIMTCIASGGSGGNYMYKWYNGSSCTGQVIGTASTLSVNSSGNYSCKVYIDGYESTCSSYDYGYASLNSSEEKTICSWNKKSDMPIARYTSASATYGNYIYIFGGNYGPSFYQYDVINDNYITKTPMSGGTDESQAAVLGNKIYLCHGFSDEKVRVYDTSSDTWETKSERPIGDFGRGAVFKAVGNYLYAFGGGDGNLSPTSQIDKYNPSNDSWTTLNTSMPTARCFASAVVYNNLIYIIGGRTSSSISTTVEVFDPSSNSWTTKSPMPQKRSGAIAELVNNKIYVVGGFNGSTYANTIQEYNLATDSWSIINLSPTLLNFADASSGVVNDKIYIMGGNNSSGPISSTEEFVLCPVVNYTISTSSYPTEGGSTSGSGNYPNGKSITVAATANSGHTFSNWSENGTSVSTNANYTFTVSGNRSLVANFTQNAVNYTISTSSNPSVGGSTSGNGSYSNGKSLTVTATANNGYSFSYWSENGTSVSTNANYTFTVSGNRILVANFTQNVVNYTISTSSNPSAGGSTSGSGSYSNGQSLTVTASSNSGYIFSYWSENGVSVSANASYTLAVSGNRNLVANFITSPNNGKTVTDIDGNVYSTVTIGSQVWLGQNLKTTKYNDGTSIPLVTDNYTWSTFLTPAYSWYNNDIGNKNPYGALYNWYAINTGKLCPLGWHVPTDAEWTALNDNLGGENIAGGKLKEVGTVHWQNPNTGATNETNFTGLPGGKRLNNGFYDIGEYGNFWSSTEYQGFVLYRNIINYGENTNKIGTDKQSGFSVRCLCDLLSTSTDELTNTNKVVFFPNPTKGFVNISLDKSIEGDFKIDVYNNVGLLMQSKKVSLSSSTTQIDLAGYSPGIYLIKISINNNVFFGKILKQ